MKKPLVAVLFALASVNAARASEPFDNANLWRSWDRNAQEAYISGAAEGMSRAFMTTMATVAQKELRDNGPKVKGLSERFLLRHTRSRLRDVMTDLYRDPANSYIEPLEILMLARDKLEGRDIASDLVFFRKSAMDTHKFNEEMKSK